MDIQTALRNIEQGKFEANYLLLGVESYLQTRFLSGITKKLSQADEPDIIHLDLNEVNIVQIIDEAELFSFFTEYRLIIVDNVSFLNAHSSQKLTDDEQKKLIAYLENPNTSSIVIWRVESDTIDTRKKISKAFLKDSTQIDALTLASDKVMNYLNHYLKENQLEMSSDAIKELLERVQSNLSNAMNEMDKLKSYALNGKQVTKETVEILVPRALESNVFELSNALLSRHSAHATKIYEDLILLKNEPIAILGLLIAQFRLMIQSKLLASSGQLEQNIATQLGVHPYRVKLALQSANKYHLKNIKHFYQELIEADYQMKNNIGDKDTYFYLLVTKFMQIK